MATNTIANPAILDRPAATRGTVGFGTSNSCDSSAARPDQRLTNRSDKREPEHPGPGTPLRQIIEHLLKVHHPFLRTRLLQMESLLDEVAVGREVNVSDLRRTLSRLHEEVACSLLRAEFVAFPKVIALIQAVELDLPMFASFKLSIAQAGCSLEAEHSTAVQAMWNLLRLTDRLKDAQASDPANKFQHQLTELANDFYQYLHELHSLLLPGAAVLESRSPVLAPAMDQESRH